MYVYMHIPRLCFVPALLCILCVCVCVYAHSGCWCECVQASSFSNSRESPPCVHIFVVPTATNLTPNVGDFVVFPLFILFEENLVCVCVCVCVCVLVCLSHDSSIAATMEASVSQPPVRQRRANRHKKHVWRKILALVLAGMGFGFLVGLLVVMQIGSFYDKVCV